MTSNTLKLWPGYLVPAEDELFSSWYVRLCSEHKIKTLSFSKIYFNNAPIWNRDIDQYCPDKIKNIIGQHTPLKPYQIENLFLSSYSGIIHNNRFSTFTINDLGIYHRKRKKYGLQFCPSCLNKEIIYYKKKWRLASSLVCSNCNIMLLDRCPTCNNPICFHRLESGYKDSILNFSLDTCFHCKNSLSNTEVILADKMYIQYQNYIDQTISLGYNDKTQYSFHYFDVLHSLQRRLFTQSKLWCRVKIAIEREFGLNLESEKLSDPHNIEQKRKSFLICYMLLEDWPKKFIAFYQRNNLNYSEFTKDTHGLPYWFTKILKEEI